MRDVVSRLVNDNPKNFV